MKTYDVIIIGAGTAGLTARKEVAKHTLNYLVVHDGPVGTTCARVGCMPSKALLQIAHDLHQTKTLQKLNLLASDSLQVDLEKILVHVRSLRDRFVKGIVTDMHDWQDKLLKGRASFLDDHTLEVNGTKISGKKIIIATGSSPLIPSEWLPYRKFILDSDSIFEQKTLPKKILVVGLGAIGIELGQALSRIGVEIVGVNLGPKVAGITDPLLQQYVSAKFRDEFPLYHEGATPTGSADGERIEVQIDGKVQGFDKVLLCIGRKPNLKNLQLLKTGVTLNKNGSPEVSKTNLSLKEKPHIFLAGDVSGIRPILHEAADEGRIAGHNTVHELECFRRKVPLGIIFSDPNIASIGENYQSLVDRGEDFVTGKVSFEGQGRAILKLKEQGLLHVYVSRKDSKILGAELQAPDGEHLAHLLCWAMSLNLTVQECLHLPFYHPVTEEGLRSALRDAALQLKAPPREIFLCEDTPIR